MLGPLPPLTGGEAKVQKSASRRSEYSMGRKTGVTAHGLLQMPHPRGKVGQILLPRPRPKSVNKQAGREGYCRRRATMQGAAQEEEIVAALQAPPSQGRMGWLQRIQVEQEKLKKEQREARAAERRRSKRMRQLKAEEEQLRRAVVAVQAALRGKRARWLLQKMRSLWRRCAVVARFRSFIKGWCTLCRSSIRAGGIICYDDLTRNSSVHVECYRAVFDIEPEETIACVAEAEAAVVAHQEVGAGVAECSIPITFTANKAAAVDARAGKAGRGLAEENPSVGPASGEAEVAIGPEPDGRQSFAEEEVVDCDVEDLTVLDCIAECTAMSEAIEVECAAQEEWDKEAGDDDGARWLAEEANNYRKFDRWLNQVADIMMLSSVRALTPQELSLVREGPPVPPSWTPRSGGGVW